MAVSQDDRRRMDRLARDLGAVETDEPPEPGAIADSVAWANEWRRQSGLAPLAENAEPPEEEFYQRARALGLRRHRG
ncbi:MAG: hypothetical protein ACRDZ7_19255 [Acidimicrobiia bacterium]